MHYHSQSSYAPSAYNYPPSSNMQYSQNPYNGYAGFGGIQYMYGYQQPRSHNHMLADQCSLADSKTESKPRLSKEEVERLEHVFKENPKPSSVAKGQLAEGLGLERPRINNWFQNRRAKAKQERKQKEYEARRRAEKASSEPTSPDDETPSSGASENGGESARQHKQPSSALFPNIDSKEDLDDGSPASDDHDSPLAQDDANTVKGQTSSDLQSPLTLDFTQPELSDFTESDYLCRPMDDFGSYIPSQHGMGHNGPDEQPANLNSSSAPSPDEQCTTGGHYERRYSAMDADFLVNSTTSPYIQSQTAFSTPMMTGNRLETLSIPNECANTPVSGHPGMSATADSFRSPPPPANIASRRNIPRPATIQTGTMRSRSYNLGGGPKTAVDGSRRVDSSSPVASIRRIVSTAGMHARIQKSTATQRSPMVFNRNPEALLHYHARSPVGAVAATFPGAAPPTPNTPAVLEQQGIREPTVSSTSSDDAPYFFNGLSSGMMPEIKVDSNLKTPPSTPGLLTQFNNANYPSNPYTATTVDYPTDQPIMTPFFQSEFNDFSIRGLPVYTEANDGSLPSTPLYPNMFGAMQDQSLYAHGSTGNTQFDWDANESVNSSKSSPNQPRSKQIQFTQNMTPQDYNSHQER